jgi:hypothetical protein
MGFRFQRRIRLFKGLTLNLSKSGTSLTVGVPGASVNVRDDKVTGNVGVPGTGMSYRESLSTDASREEGGRSGTKFAKVFFWLLVIALIAVFLGK